MVIECFDAMIANAAMRTSWWSVEFACHTPVNNKKENQNLGLDSEIIEQYINKFEYFTIFLPL